MFVLNQKLKILKLKNVEHILVNIHNEINRNGSNDALMEEQKFAHI